MVNNYVGCEGSEKARKTLTRGTLMGGAGE